MGLILYDPKYNSQKPTTIEYIAELSGQSVEELLEYKRQIKKVKKIKCYIIDEEDITLKLRKQLYAKEVYKNEAWKEVEGSGGIYKVSSAGRFKRVSKSNPEGRYILPFFQNRKRSKYISEDKRPLIKVKFKGVYNDFYAARIVAYHFCNIHDEDKDKKYINYTEKDFDKLVVYHKNGIVYDNNASNLVILDRQDLNKKIGKNNKGKRTIVCRCAKSNRVIDYYNSSREAAKALYIGKTTIQDALNKKRLNPVVVGRYLFEYED